MVLEGKQPFYNVFSILYFSLYLIYCKKSVFTFRLYAITKKLQGGKNLKKGPKWEFSPPYNFFAIGFSKKVKTLFNSKSGMKKKMK